MAARPLTLSPSYLATVRGTRELHRLIADGKDDSPEAEAIRDASDGPWEALSEAERDRVRSVAEDLYSLYEEPPAKQEMTKEAQAGLNEAYEERERGEWDRSLELLRTWRAYIDPFLVSYLRGTIWVEAGDPATAALFFQHAHKLNAENGSNLAMYLYALNLANPPAASKEAQKILDDHRNYSPIAYVRAADIQLMAARVLSDADGNRIFLALEPILKDALQGAQNEPRKIDKSTVVTALSLLGFGYEFLTRFQDAVNCYSTVLELEPNNDAILVARGMLLYGRSPQGIADLERAVEVGSPLIWPYAMLAFRGLRTQQYKECLRLCELALERNGSPATKSEIHEWEGAAQAALEFSPGSFELAFEQAVRTDTGNDRAKRNLKKVKSAPRKPPPEYWELRTEETVRKSALTERRYAMA